MATEVDTTPNKYHTEDLSDQTFLVTGGAGFIGSHLVDYLMYAGAKKVVVLDDFSTGFRENLTQHADDDRLQVVEGDITDPEIGDEVCRGVDVVFHQAALGSVPRSIKDPVTTNKINVDGFVNVAFAAVRHNVNRVVYASSSSVYGDSPTLPKTEEKTGNLLSPYAVSKMANELYANVLGLNYATSFVGLRYFNVFGPRQSPEGPYAAVIPLFMKAASAGDQPVIFGDGKQSRDFTYVANVIEANIRAAFVKDKKAVNTVYNVAYGTRIDLLELWELISGEFGLKISAKHGPERMGDIKHSLADITKSNQQLGYSPQYSVKEGLAITVDYFRKLNL